MNWVELKTFFFQKVQHVSELIHWFIAGLDAVFCGLLVPIGAAKKWVVDLEKVCCEKI